MEAIIQISKIGKEFNQDQLNVIRRITNVLKEHELIVEVYTEAYYKIPLDVIKQEFKPNKN